MKQRIAILFTLVALVAVLLTGCSLGDSASAVLPVVGTVTNAVQAALPTVASQADATIQEVAQVAPTTVPSVDTAPAGDTAPAVIEPVPVAPTSQEQQVIDLYNRVNPGVVTIYMTTGSGSGFIVDAAGYIVTNNHVIAEGGEINVLFHDGDVKTAELVGTDAQADIALLKVEAASGELTALSLGDSNALQVGQSVIAIGAPFGLPNTLTTGVVSGLSRAMPVEELGLGANYQTPDVIQTDAAINPGNSGGPLITMSGEVIGINTAIESPVRANSGVGFAVPSNLVKVVIGQLRDTGEVRYPWLGIAGGTLTPDAAEELGLPRDTRGVLVSEVTTGGPAAAAGLRGLDPTTNTGADVITGIDNLTVTEFDDLLGYIVQQAQVGQSITITFLRDGQPQTTTVTLGERPAATPQDQLPQQQQP